ncbi:DUF397 domain-containing protein [Streptomyces sp. NRRL S-920]|uniref:DUF397 domain-containing protein n=1 Tax=Streptomyces sp. NRRL S-920 TaxID=1463921 RepID=UPI0004C84B98|nr:DUF397 domain-containing protein [Streptomyces sp. NRRL S-920]
MSNTDDRRLQWVKSSYSSGDGGQCVEWAPEYAATTGEVPVRDSKKPGGPILTVPAAAWTAFVGFARCDG